MLPVECVARGYLSGSGWSEYRATGEVCGVPLPAGLTESAKLPEPIFTPATKATQGHDENVSFAAAAATVGRERVERLRDPHARPLPAGRRSRRDVRADFGGLEVRVRHAPGRLGDAAAVRRSPHAGQFPVLAGGPV